MFKSFAHFKISFVLFCFCYWVALLLYIFWILTLSQTYGLQIFSPVPWVVFSFCWLLILLCKTFFVWCCPTYLFFTFLLVLLVSVKKIIAKTNVMKCFPMFSWRSKVSGLIFKSLTYFNSIFMNGVQFNYFACKYFSFTTPFSEETIISLLTILDSLVKLLVDCIHVGLFLGS